MSRRLDASYLAELVLDHQLQEAEAHAIARALVSDIPRAAFRLEGVGGVPLPRAAN
jgi:glucuronate isomerase